MSQHTLTSGHVVTLRDIDTLKVKDRKALLRAADSFGDDELGGGLAMMDKTLMLIVEQWDFPLPLPTDAENSLDELALTDYDELQALADDYRKRLFPDFEPNRDKESPTGASNA